MIAHDRRRALANRVASGAFRFCGIASIVVLVGIFLLLAYNASHAFWGGVESEPLAPAERAALGPEAAQAIDEARAAPPSVTDDFLGSTTWRPRPPASRSTACSPWSGPPCSPPRSRC